MANNIQIVGNILNSSTISRYSAQDTRLISSQEIQDDFGADNDYIEYYIYDAGGNLLDLTYDYNDFKLPFNSSLTPPPNDSTSNTTNSIPSTNVGIVSNTNTQSGSLYPIIEIDPVQDLQNNGYTSGEFTVKYNFFRYKIASPTSSLFIKEISPDRTEIGVISTTLTNEEIEQGFNTLVSEISGSIYFVDYLLNFGANQQALTVNVALNKLDSGYEIYFKLYEPLPQNIVEKSTLWVVDEKVDPYTFDINLDTLILTPPGLQLRGPNFNVPVKLQEGTISTSYQNYDNLLNNLQSLQSSSYSKILNLLTTQSIDINVDYTNFSEFSFFGSSKQRLENFYTKVKEIEDYNNLINTYTPNIVTTSSLQLEISSSKNSINDIISKFDGFEYYLYFESSSYAWPKTNSILPYTLYSTGSTIALNWYNSYTSSAESYDNNNVNLLKNTLPTFILDDCNNDQYIVFVNMMGQYFDNIWIFLKAITDVNLANNNLEQGVSKDLVYHVLKSYGIKLYNSQGGEDLDQFLIGANSGSAVFDDNFSPTGSYLNNIPRKDLLSEIYKRIYHNLPYLVKNKGTVAGVEGLITTFGITGSILNTKEFGGGTKSSLLKGYNNEKIRIVDNAITGSALSPFISLQQSPSASIEFRDDDLNYLDVSFSPQTQIDTYISGAIASNNPTFNLDDYIGDPRQQYDNVYPDLNAQRKLYFETGVSGYSGFTGSYMDYNGFIRLIQFFDNALFKMITDFVPARTSLSTGVTINSPVLERNKVSYAEPLINNQAVYDADYNGPRISPQYGQLYNSLTGSKAAFFTGELSGSEIDIYNNYFLPANSNYYLHPTSSLTTNDLDIFNHSNFNVMLNNVTSSRLSLTRQGIEYIIDNTGSLSNRTILTPVQLQDSYQSLTSYNNSRYEGSKVISYTYNDYTPKLESANGIIWGGDRSFGKTAAVDKYVRKIGLFTQIIQDKFLPQRNDISIKYLVDEFGGLTELNPRNKHWEEVQNTFIAGDDITITLFDNQKFNNQRATDGVKPIFNSGYIYEPVFYALSASNASSADIARQDKTASFDYVGNTINQVFSVIPNAGSIKTSGGNYNLTQINAVNDLIPVAKSSDVGNYIAYNLFDLNTPYKAGEYNDTVYFNSVSSPLASSYYSVPSTDKYSFTANFKIKIDYPTNTSGRTFKGYFRVRNSNSPNNDIGEPISFIIITSQYYLITPYIFQPLRYIPTPDNNRSSFTSTIETRVNNYRNSTNIGYTLNPGTVFEPYIISYPDANYKGGPDGTFIDSPIGTQELVWKIKGTNQYFYSDNSNGDFSGIYDNSLRTVDIQYSATDVPLIEGNQIYFELLFSGDSFTPEVPNIEILPGGNLRVDLKGGIPVVFSAFLRFDTKKNTVDITGKSNRLASVYGPNFTFLPTGSLYGTNSLYSQYGDVNYPFEMNEGDIILLTQASGSVINEYLINKIEYASDAVKFNVVPPLPSNMSSTIYSFVFLKKVKDETNILSKFRKPLGNTSYGFIIPENLHPDVLNNIDTITKEVKLKLLADQQGNIVS
jgi:hypothetical protein